MTIMEIARKQSVAFGQRYLLTGIDSNRLPAWYLVEVPLLRCALFEKAVQAPPVTLEQYGIILDSGYGPPPEDARQN